MARQLSFRRKLESILRLNNLPWNSACAGVTGME